MKVLSHIAQHFNLIPPSEAGMTFYLRLGDKKAEVQSGWTQIFLQTDSSTQSPSAEEAYLLTNK